MCIGNILGIHNTLNCSFVIGNSEYGRSNNINSRILGNIGEITCINIKELMESHVDFAVRFNRIVTKRNRIMFDCHIFASRFVVTLNLNISDEAVLCLNFGPVFHLFQNVYGIVFKSVFKDITLYAASVSDSGFLVDFGSLQNSIFGIDNHTSGVIEFFYIEINEKLKIFKREINLSVIGYYRCGI